MEYLTKLSRTFRKSQTPAEGILWECLRRKQILGCKFRRQHVLHRYIVDFVCLSKKLIIEIDGSQHADAIEYDQIRTEYLINLGYKEIRFWNHEIYNNLPSVLKIITKELIMIDELAHSASESINFPNSIGEMPTSVAKLDKRGMI